MLERLWYQDNTPPLLVEIQTSTAALEINTPIFQKNRKQPISRPSNIYPLGIYPKDVQSYHKNMCSIMFIAALFVIARSWKQLKCPLTEEWIKKIWYIYTFTRGVLQSGKKNNDIVKFSDIVLSEVTKTQKDKCHMY